MKKSMLVFAMLGIVPAVCAYGYDNYRSSSSQYTTTRPSGTYTKTSNVRRTSGYNNTINNNFYYSQPAAQPAPVTKRSQIYQDYDTVVVQEPVATKKSVVRKERNYSSQERKYFLAHPFFQPLKGRFGSITDLSYTKNDFKFDILDGIITPQNGTYRDQNFYGGYAVSGKADITQLLVKEDVSFGLSDTLSLVLMAQYDKTKIKFKDWSSGDPADESSSSGLNVFGIGLQNRFVDNDEWIAMFSAAFQHQKDTANSFIFDVKGGYKIDRSTVYGLARVGYSSLTSGNQYGAVVEESDGGWIALAYKQDVKDVFYVEGGVGVFSVLNKITYLGGELVYGHYDWHNQLNIKGTIGIQPNDSFALSLYASTSFYDSAKGQTRRYTQYDVNPEDVDIVQNDVVVGTITDSTLNWVEGDYKINSYNEWKIGVQGILYF